MAVQPDKKSADLNAIVEQTQPPALRLLDNKALGALLRDLRAMKAGATDLEMQKTLAQAIRRAAAEKRLRQAAAEDDVIPAAPEAEAPTKAEKAEEKRRKAAVKAEKQRVKDAEKAERKAANALAKAERQAKKPKPGKKAKQAE